MEILQQLVRKLVVLSIFAGFCELLLPSSTFRNYARLITGLLVIALLLQPVLTLIGTDWNPEQLLMPDFAGGQEYSLDTDTLGDAARELVEGQLAERAAIYLESYFPQSQVQALLDVEFDVHGNLTVLRGVHMRISPPEQEQTLVAPVRIGSRGEEWEQLQDPELIRALAGYLEISPQILSISVLSREGEEHGNGL